MPSASTPAAGEARDLCHLSIEDLALKREKIL